MKYNISAFTHKGSVREINQDRILVQNQLLQDGICDFVQAEYCACFVADGIGGNQSGEVASQFVLEKLVHWLEGQCDFSEERLSSALEHINEGLLLLGREHREHYGSSTTLAGLIIQDDEHVIMSVGDSPLWLLRNGMFYQLTEDQVINPNEENSPLISYFGGKDNNLFPQFHHDLREILADDLFLLCSDGLFKSLKYKQIKAIVSNNQELKEKSRFLLKKAIEIGVEDNVSCILVEIV